MPTIDATELIEKFNKVLRLTQDAWKYDGMIEADEEYNSVKLKRSEEKHAAADAAAREFCRLLSGDESR